MLLFGCVDELWMDAMAIVHCGAAVGVIALAQPWMLD